MMQLAETHTREIDWWPSIGDPTPMAWAIVGLYLAAAVLGARCFIRRGEIGPVLARRYGVFWLLVMFFMILLGVNKQWDLQVAAHELARNTAIDLGWFGERDRLKRWFAAGVAGAGVLLGLMLFFLLRGLWRMLWPALAGLAVLGLFALERVVHFLVIELPLDRALIGPVQINHAIESCGIVLVAAGALAAARRAKTAEQPASHIPA